MRAVLEQNPRPTNYAQVLDAASSFTSLMQEPKLQKQVLAGLEFLRPGGAARRSAHLLRTLPATIPQSAPPVKTAFANLNDSALQRSSWKKQGIRNS